MTQPQSPDLVQSYIGLGANLGDARATLRTAAQALATTPGIDSVRLSAFYRTAPVGADGPDYVNAVAEINTSLNALALLGTLQAIELAHGRQRPYRHAPRTLDLDLLCYGNQTIQLPQLTVPHPRMHERAFVLRPLMDLAPDLMLPQGRPADLLAACTGQQIHRLPWIRLVVAYTDDRVIGHAGGMPWHLPGDLAHFKRSTLGHPVVMGRKTWQSIGRPLPGRRNLVLTRDLEFKPAGAECFASLEAALASCTHAEYVCVIGGEQIFELALPLADELIATEIHAKVQGDTWFPVLPPAQWQETERQPQTPEQALSYDFVTYRPVTSLELS